MRRYTWKALERKLLFRPVLLVKLLQLPNSYETLDEWIKVDDLKIDIAVRLIGCRGAESLKLQRKEMMRYTKYLRDEQIYLKKVDEISERYAKKSLCHRKFSGEDAGVICYCK